MSIEYLLKLRDKIKQLYDEEKSKYDSTLDKKSKALIQGQLDDISKELFKVNILIDIYSKNNDKKYVILRLERLYMMLMSETSEKQFEALTKDEMFEIFERYFPNGWVYKIADAQKEQLLLDAISKNGIINLSEVKKLKRVDGE